MIIMLLIALSCLKQIYMTMFCRLISFIWAFMIPCFLLMNCLPKSCFQDCKEILSCTTRSRTLVISTHIHPSQSLAPFIWPGSMHRILNTTISSLKCSMSHLMSLQSLSNLLRIIPFSKTTQMSLRHLWIINSLLLFIGWADMEMLYHLQILPKKLHVQRGLLSFGQIIALKQLSHCMICLCGP